ncbi:hypothetical protein CI102_8660 [Trichoderma harzianum]|nr:hypothetical protein CI102_8660 [Trichoderma harzianum]
MRLLHFNDPSVEEQRFHRSLGVATRGCGACFATADIPQSLFKITWNVWPDKLRRLFEGPIRILVASLLVASLLVASRVFANGHVRCFPVETDRKFKLSQCHCT